MTKVYIETYGCWLNKAESEIIRGIVREKGGKIVNRIEESDIVILNTCAVREETELRMLKRIRELSNFDDKRLIITGCLVNVRPYTILKIVPEASLIEPDGIGKIDEVIISGKREIILRKYERDLSRLPVYEGGVIYVVPIETGCLGSCSFCIERVSRGRTVKSYPIDVIVKHVKEAVIKGAKEVFLTGQDLAAYGYDKGIRLTDLLKVILEDVNGNYRIRIGMMEPWLVSKLANDLAKIMQDERIFKYLHLPAQSGDDRILKLMNRKYKVNEYENLVNFLRNRLGELCIVTDIIVGYPGEDEVAFKNTLSFVKKVGFDKVHVARFTLRPFTEAYLLPQIPERLKKQRSRILSEHALKVAYEVNKRYVGKRKITIVERQGKDGGFIARTEEYKPVILEEHVNLGEEVEVVITRATPVSLVGKSAN